jgi:hypothetical protein
MNDILKHLVDVLYIMHKVSGKATGSVLCEFNLKDPNACHQSIGRSFIVMRMPTASPFSDQVFPAQGKP